MTLYDFIEILFLSAIFIPLINALDILLIAYLRKKRGKK